MAEREAAAQQNTRNSKARRALSFFTSLLLLTFSQRHFILPKVSGSLRRELQSRTTRSRRSRFPNDGGILSSLLPATDRFLSRSKLPNLPGSRMAEKFSPASNSPTGGIEAIREGRRSVVWRVNK